jgi:hypothetical protein
MEFKDFAPEGGGRKYRVSKCGKVYGVQGPLKLTVRDNKSAPSEVVVTIVRGTSNGSTMSGYVVLKNLVAEHWVDNPAGHKYINCIDNNRLNVHADNLEWVPSIKDTYSEGELEFDRAKSTLVNRGYKVRVEREPDGSLVAVNPQEHYITSKKANNMVSDCDLDDNLPIIPNGVGVILSNAEIAAMGRIRRKETSEEARLKAGEALRIRRSRLALKNPIEGLAKIKPGTFSNKEDFEARLVKAKKKVDKRGVTQRGCFGRPLEGRRPTMDAYGRPLDERK